MRFDWQRFFERYGVEYVDRGPNVKHGELNIACPWCGDDPSHHLGVRSDNGWFSCWRGRDKGHAGKSPHRLIMKLLHCSRDRADAIVGTRSIPEGALEEARQRLMGVPVAPSTARHLEWPDEFAPLQRKSAHRRGWEYLISRGYDDSDVHALVENYDLRYAVVGSFAMRVIVPIIDDVGDGPQLVSWTGRSVYPDASLRYLSLPSDPDSASRLGMHPAVLNLRDTVHQAPQLERDGGKVLVITEGPFDALRLDLYGREQDVRATCLFGLSPSDRQVYALDRVGRAFDQVIVMSDARALSSAQRCASRLAHLGARAIPTPYGADDPGDLTRDQISEWIRNVLSPNPLT